MNLVSLSAADSQLQEDGLEISRVVISNAALHIINQIGKPYTAIGQQVRSVTVPEGGTISRIPGLISITSITNLSTAEYEVITAETLDGQPTFDIGEEMDRYGIPLSLCVVQESTMVFDQSLWGKTVTLTYTAVPMAEDGWLLVSEHLIEPVLLYIENKLIRGKMVRAGLQSNPTNNMIIATKRGTNVDYHRSVAYARSEIARETEEEKL